MNWICCQGVFCNLDKYSHILCGDDWEILLFQSRKSDGIHNEEFDILTFSDIKERNIAYDFLKNLLIYEGFDMDKQIKKVQKDLKKGEKDTSKLLKMDKKFDKKLEKCDIVKKKK